MAIRITKADINRYTEGDCHVLAREIHRLTGWPFHCFVQKRKSTLHAFVEMPDYPDNDDRVVDPQQRKFTR